jgi:hypothetical protein
VNDIKFREENEIERKWRRKYEIKGSGTIASKMQH